MRIYLIRHGSARDKKDDPERHLSDGGKKEAASVAAYLRGLAIGADCIWHSGKARAAETAEILAPALGTDEVIECSGLLPNDPVSPIADELGMLTEDTALAGHLPFLEKLAALLLTGDAALQLMHLPPAGVACLERDEEGVWRLVWLVEPSIV